MRQPRGVRVVIGIMVACALVAFAGSVNAFGHWVDVYDSTCGALYRYDLWMDRGFCHGKMLLQAAQVVGFALLAAGCMVVAVHLSRRFTPESGSAHDGVRD